MPESVVYVRPPVNALPVSDPLSARMQSLRAAVEAFGLKGQMHDEVGLFASIVSAYESLLPFQSLALARMEQLLWEGNRESLPITTVRWHRDPLNADPLASAIPRALGGLRTAIFGDALGGKLGSAGAQGAVTGAFAALTAQLAPPSQTVILECQAAMTVDSVPGKVSSWTLVSASDSRYVAIYIASFGIASFGENPGAGNA